MSATPWANDPIIGSSSAAPWANDPIIGGARATPKVDRKAAAQEALEGTSGLERAMINLGAGADTAIEGVKQLFGGGMDSAQVKEKRERDSVAADSVPLGGALQIAGEIGPSMIIPGGAAVRGVQALRAAPSVARLGGAAAAADGAIVGAGMGAAQLKTDDESRLFNTIAGAVGGAALPALIAGGRMVREILTTGGAESKAAAKLIEAVGGEAQADAVLAKLRSYQPGPVTRDIPMSTAEVSQSLPLGRAERVAQARSPETWAPLRSDQAQGRYDALQRATAGADNLDPAKQARAAATAPMRDDALGAAAGNDYATPVHAAAAWMRQGEAATNPAVQRIAGYVESNLKNATPEQLYTIRKTLLAKLNGKAQLGDELSAATKQARAGTMAMVRSIDDALDGASGGKWSPYLKEYAGKSGEVDNAKALTLIRESFERETMPQLAGVPQVTGANLARSIDKSGRNSYGETINSQSRAGLRELQENVGMSEGLQKLLRLTGTSGGGSNTATDIAGLGAEVAGEHVSRLIPGLKAALQRSDRMTQAAMSDALRNPDLFISAVSRKLEQRKPLTRIEESVLTLLRSAGSGAALESIEPR